MRAMKESGIPWIGKIDSRVQMTPVKYLLDGGRNAVKVGPFGSQLSGTDFQNEETDYWVYNQRSVIDKNASEGTAFISEEKYNSMRGFHVKPGDILITTRGTIGKVFRLPINVNKGILHPCIIRFRLNDSAYDYDLFEMIFNESDMVSRQLLYESNSTTIEVIYSETLRNIKVPVWTMEMQKSISKFLKEKCAEIDALSADIQSEIETLEAYKRSVITEAVTKGLNKNVPMKDSGIEWVGEIPATWDVEKGKYCLTYVQKPTKPDDDVITCFRDGEVTLRRNRREEGFTISLKEIGYQGIDVGDLIVHGMDGFAGAIGISDSRGKASPVLNVLDTDNNKRYIMYYLRSLAFNGVFLALATGIRVRTCDTNWGKIRELLYVLPPKSEQDEIVAFIDDRINATDEIIAQKQEQLVVLAEYKKSVIYEYVTGKKEVPAV